VPIFARALGLPRTLAQLTELTAQARTAATTPPPGGQVLQVASGPPAVAITFDDGPHPEGTPRILQVLAEHNARATFFLVGEQVVKRPELARRIVNEGHAIGLHGYRHLPHPARRDPQLRDDYKRGIYAIASATNVQPRLHRPPYGIYSPASLDITRQQGLQPLLWSRWGKDWRKFTTPERISRRVITGLEAGDVILLHDADFYSSKRSHRRTAAALPEILKMLKSAELDTVAAA
jgi:peptidoglycan/xylan/chitin deacetylase (PgdA/CDA1 family)